MHISLNVNVVMLFFRGSSASFVSSVNTNWLQLLSTMKEQATAFQRQDFQDCMWWKDFSGVIVEQCHLTARKSWLVLNQETLLCVGLVLKCSPGSQNTRLTTMTQNVKLTRERNTFKVSRSVEDGDELPALNWVHISTRPLFLDKWRHDLTTRLNTSYETGEIENSFHFSTKPILFTCKPASSVSVTSGETAAAQEQQRQLTEFVVLE